MNSEWKFVEVRGKQALPHDRYGHGAVTLENGQILVIGGKRRSRGRLDFFLLDVEEAGGEGVAVSVAHRDLTSFEERWGFAYAYYPRERLLFLNGGLSDTHHYGQTILLQVTAKSLVPVLVSNVVGPMARGYHAAALSLEGGEKAVYVFGGQSCFGGPHTYYNDVHRFDLETNLWEEVQCTEDGQRRPSRPHPRSQSLAFVRGGFLYVYGGYDGRSVLADMYRLDLATKTWTSVWVSAKFSDSERSPVGVAGLRPADFRIYPCRPAGLVVNDRLVVLSEDYENGTALLHGLDLRTFRWLTTTRSMGPPARGNATLSLTRNGHLLMIGGQARKPTSTDQPPPMWAFRLPQKMDWAQERVLWIACFKNRPDEGCLLARCPPHIIYHIISYVNAGNYL